MFITIKLLKWWNAYSCFHLHALAKWSEYFLWISIHLYMCTNKENLFWTYMKLTSSYSIRQTFLCDAWSLHPSCVRKLNLTWGVAFKTNRAKRSFTNICHDCLQGRVYIVNYLAYTEKYTVISTIGKSSFGEYFLLRYSCWNAWQWAENSVSFNTSRETVQNKSNRISICCL